MPRISAFYGIVVFMFFDDHNPPHYHAHAAEREIVVRIADGSVLRGGLRPTDERRLLEWHRLHQEELAANWDRARRSQPLLPIAPLP